MDRYSVYQGTTCYAQSTFGQKWKSFLNPSYLGAVPFPWLYYTLFSFCNFFYVTFIYKKVSTKNNVDLDFFQIRTTVKSSHFINKKSRIIVKNPGLLKIWRYFQFLVSLIVIPSPHTLHSSSPIFQHFSISKTSIPSSAQSTHHSRSSPPKGGNLKIHQHSPLKSSLLRISNAGSPLVQKVAETHPDFFPENDETS